MEQSFAEKLKIQAIDKRAAILDDFITQTVERVKTYTQSRADQGYFDCEITSNDIPAVILPSSIYSDNDPLKQMILHIIKTLRSNLEECGFTTLTINRSYPSQTSKALAIVCKWN